MLFWWERIHGVQIGPWFIGAIKGRKDERCEAPRENETTTLPDQKLTALGLGGQS